MTQFQRFCLALTPLLLFCTGCGWGGSDFEYAKLYKAQGSLTINGKPAEGAMLIFSPLRQQEQVDKRGTRPHAYVDASGNFQVTTYQEGDGIPLGEYKIALIWEDKPNSSSSWDKLDSQYVNPDSTNLRVAVAPGDNQFEPMKLEGVKIVTQPPKQKTYDKDGVE